MKPVYVKDAPFEALKRLADHRGKSLGATAAELLLAAARSELNFVPDEPEDPEINPLLDPLYAAVLSQGLFEWAGTTDDLRIAMGASLDQTRPIGCVLGWACKHANTGVTSTQRKPGYVSKWAIIIPEAKRSLTPAPKYQAQRIKQTLNHVPGGFQWVDAFGRTQSEVIADFIAALKHFNHRALGGVACGMSPEGQPTANCEILDWVPLTSTDL